MAQAKKADKPKPPPGRKGYVSGDLTYFSVKRKATKKKASKKKHA